MNSEEVREIIDQNIKENEVVMRICIPKGKLEPLILSSESSQVYDFHILLYSLKKVFNKILAEETEKRSRKLRDALVYIVEKELLKEEE